MACFGSTQCRHAKVVAQRRLFGTWDFKWRQGTEIRVAFIDDDATLNQLVELDAPGEKVPLHRAVIKLAQRWLEEAEGLPGTPNISFEWIEDDEAKRAAAKKKYREIQADPKKRSTGEGRRDADPYDVLLTFDDLPRIRAFSAADDNSILASSHLGSYARRERLYVPTAFLGISSERPKTALPYFDSAEFRWTVIHEFGHILGLAHEHQNPLVPLEWLPAQEIAAIFQGVFGLTKDLDYIAQYVKSELTGKWPSSPPVNGSVPFSDWQGGTAEEALESIMSFPLAKQLVASTKNRPAKGDPALLASAFSGFKNRPTWRDLKQLRTLYPPTYM